MVIFDLYLDQGSTFTQQLTLSQDYSGLVIDADIVVGDVRISGVATWDNDATGTFSILVSATDTSSLPTGVGHYDVEIINGTFVSKAMKGRVYVSGEITQ